MYRRRVRLALILPVEPEQGTHGPIALPDRHQDVPLPAQEVPEAWPGSLRQVLRQRGNPEKMPLDGDLDLAQRLVRLRGDDPIAHYRLGHVWLDLARPHDALAAGEAAVALHPECLPAWDLVAQSY